VIPALANDDAKRYISAGEREVEAALVETLATAFVGYEVYPPASGNGLGRYSPVSLIPPVGSVLRKKLADREGRQGVERAVMRTLSLGYAMFASLGIGDDATDLRIVEDRDPEAMWAYWVTHTHSQYVGNMLAPDFADAVTNLSVDEFLIGLEEAGAMPRLGKRTKLHLLGRLYGEAGVLLRHVQSRALTNERLRSDPFAQTTMNWPLDAAPRGHGT
jgi:hypothetical protein